MKLMQAAAQQAGQPGPHQLDVRFVAGESYEVDVGGHRVIVDQPVDYGGHDSAPTPTDLFAAALAACVAFYAGRFLTRHGYSRDGLGVSASYEMAPERPARVGKISVTVQVPASLPLGRWPALRSVVAHCTVHNSLLTPPAVAIHLT